MKIRVGINGMGRIGRMIVRSIIESNNNKIEIKHINNRTNSENCSKLLKYDSIHGKFNADISCDDKHLVINRNKITFSQETDLNNIDWIQAVCSEKKGELKAEIKSAKELSKDEINKITEELSSNFKSKIKLNYNHDKTLIGGLVVQVGSIMIDTSIKSKLQKIENKMVGA